MLRGGSNAGPIPHRFPIPRGRERIRIRDFINNISKDLPFKRRLFNSQERSQTQEGSTGRKSKNRNRICPQPLPKNSCSCEWKPPSARTQAVVREMFDNLFNENNEINNALIEKTITICPPDEDVLLVEDRDHYNVLQKAIIFGHVPLVTILLNHGCEVNGVKSADGCTISGKKCPHESLGSLHLACYLGQSDIVLLLLQRGADKTLARRVYTSAVINDPLRLQPSVLNSSRLSRAEEIVSKCGSREPIFYAVLGDHLDIVKILLAEQPDPRARPDPQYRYLVHLACRVGAFRCLRFLLDIYPDEINTKDADGLPMLLMALNHDLKFVIMLLNHGADIHSLDDLWEPGSNMLHLLYQGLPIDGANDTNSISFVTEMCLQRGINVNGQRNPFNRIPLQDLLSVINIPVVCDPQLDTTATSEMHEPADEEERNNRGENALEEQSRFDDELYKCVKLLLKYGSNVNLKDDNNKSPLQILLLNGNHTIRCNICQMCDTPDYIKEALFARSYGLDNTILICRLLLEAGSTIEPNENGSTPLRDLVELMCSSYFAPNWAWDHSLEILEVVPLFEGYLELINMLLEYGTDPNICPPSELPPLLYLLSYVADSPYHVNDYVIPQGTADSLAKMIWILLKHGAKTEVSIAIKDMPMGERTRNLGCFDMLTSILSQMQKYHSQHKAKDLGIIQALALPLVQYGASSVVYHKLLYTVPTSSTAPWRYCMHAHSFLYQYLHFGLLNLQYVNDEHWYRDLFQVLYSHTDHYTLQDVLNKIFLELHELHGPENTCSCGECGQLRDILDAVIGQPRNLKQQVRLSIYQIFGGRAGDKVNLLPLPQQMKDYLLYIRM